MARILAELKRQEDRIPYSAFQIASAYSALGDKNQAFAWLDKAYQQDRRSLTYIRVEVAFEGLHSDPRFQDLLRRMGLQD